MATTIALAGNPNSGKTTLFNQLTGNHQYTGNWPGVTVERKTGTLKGDKEVEFVDLPGIYSLSPYSNEEVVSRNYLSSGQADAIIDVIDASNLERNLYLAEQLMEFGVPLVLALNQMDIVKKRGYTIKSRELSERLNVPVVEISALKGEGMEDLVQAAVKAARDHAVPTPVKFSAPLERYLERVEAKLPADTPERLKRWYTVKFFERDERAGDGLSVDSIDVDDIILEAESEFDDRSDAIITNERFKYITNFINEVQKRTLKGLSTSEKIDRVLTNRILALPIFVVIIALVYYIAISSVGTYFTDWANDGLFGDGWFVASMGREAFDEDSGTVDDANNDIDAFLQAAAESDNSELADAADTLTAYIGSEAEDDADLDDAEYTEALATLEAQATDLVGTTHVVDEETAEADEHEVDLATFEEDVDTATGELAEKVSDPGNYGPWVPGIPVLCEAGLEAIAAPEWLSSLVLDGIVAGVGAVLGFVPQIMVLFFLLAILEGCGYMARVTFILDRIFRRFGLSGKTFIPMLVGTGCGVPGVMASRTIESESSRHLTVMTTTFMPCSAKLPIIALISTAFFGGAWWVAPSAYFLGIASIIVSGIMLKKTRPFMGETTPYIMELPEYRLPRFVDLLRSMWERAWAFIKKAGTIILLATIIVWYLSSYGIEGGGYAAVENMDNSFLAYFGNAICWIFAPLGLGNWECTSGIITGLLAKENLVGTMAVLYSTDPDIAWTTTFMQSLNTLTGGFGACAAFAYLVFNLLCAPCFAAMGAIKREMGGFNKWFWAAIGYEMVFAWVVALMFFQFSKVAAGGPVDIWFILAVVDAAFILFMLFRPAPKADTSVDTDKTAAAAA